MTSSNFSSSKNNASAPNVMDDNSSIEGSFAVYAERGNQSFTETMGRQTDGATEVRAANSNSGNGSSGNSSGNIDASGSSSRSGNLDADDNSQAMAEARIRARQQNAHRGQHGRGMRLEKDQHDAVSSMLSYINRENANMRKK